MYNYCFTLDSCCNIYSIYCVTSLHFVNQYCISNINQIQWTCLVCTNLNVHKSQLCISQVLGWCQYNPVGVLGQEIYIGHRRNNKQQTDSLAVLICRNENPGDQKSGFENWLCFKRWLFAVCVGKYWSPLSFSASKALFHLVRSGKTTFCNLTFVKTLWLSFCREYILVLFVHPGDQVTFLRRPCHLSKCCHHKFSNIWHEK